MHSCIGKSGNLKRARSNLNAMGCFRLWCNYTSAESQCDPLQYIIWTDKIRNKSWNYIWNCPRSWRTENVRKQIAANDGYWLECFRSINQMILSFSRANNDATRVSGPLLACTVQWTWNATQSSMQREKYKTLIYRNFVFRPAHPNGKVNVNSKWGCCVKCMRIIIQPVESFVSNVDDFCSAFSTIHHCLHLGARAIVAVYVCIRILTAVSRTHIQHTANKIHKMWKKSILIVRFAFDARSRRLTSTWAFFVSLIFWRHKCAWIEQHRARMRIRMLNSYFNYFLPMEYSESL